MRKQGIIGSRITWSWASVSSFRRISLRFLRREFCNKTEIIAATTELATADPTGAVSAGSIRLRGLMKEIAFCSGQFPDHNDLYYWTEPSRKSELFFEVPMDPCLGVACFLLGSILKRPKIRGTAKPTAEICSMCFCLTQRP